MWRGVQGVRDWQTPDKCFCTTRWDPVAAFSFSTGALRRCDGREIERAAHIGVRGAIHRFNMRRRRGGGIRESDSGRRSHLHRGKSIHIPYFSKSTDAGFVKK